MSKGKREGRGIFGVLRDLIGRNQNTASEINEGQDAAETKGSSGSVKKRSSLRELFGRRSPSSIQEVEPEYRPPMPTSRPLATQKDKEPATPNVLAESPEDYNLDDQAFLDKLAASLKYPMDWKTYLNTQDGDGNTALHRAIQHQRLGENGLAARLLRLGADPRIENKKGETPLALSENFIISKEFKDKAQYLNVTAPIKKTSPRPAVQQIKAADVGNASPQNPTGEIDQPIGGAAKAERDVQEMYKGIDPYGEEAPTLVEDKEPRRDLASGQDEVKSSKDKSRRMGVKFSKAPDLNAGEGVMQAEPETVKPEAVKPEAHGLQRQKLDSRLKAAEGKKEEYKAKLSDPEQRSKLLADIRKKRRQEILKKVRGEILGNQKDENGQTALHRYVLSNNNLLVNIALDLGADATVENKEGKTALQIATEKGNTQIIKTLLDKGADPYADLDVEEFAENLKKMDAEASTEFETKATAKIDAKVEAGAKAESLVKGPPKKDLPPNPKDIDKSKTASLPLAEDKNKTVPKPSLNKGQSPQESSQAGLSAVDKSEVASKVEPKPAKMEELSKATNADDNNAKKTKVAVKTGIPARFRNKAEAGTATKGSDVNVPPDAAKKNPIPERFKNKNKGPEVEGVGKTPRDSKQFRN